MGFLDRFTKNMGLEAFTTNDSEVMASGEPGTATITAYNNRGSGPRVASSDVTLQVTPNSGEPFEWTGFVLVESDPWGVATHRRGLINEIPVRFSADRAKLAIDWETFRPQADAALAEFKAGIQRQLKQLG